MKFINWLKSITIRPRRRRRGYEPVKMGDVDENNPPKGGTAIVRR